MRKPLITGFPGFLARMLVRELAPEVAGMTLVVEERHEEEARRRAKFLCGLYGLPAERFEILPGDIVRPDLGLAPDVRRRLAAEIDAVFHLAALYDLAVAEEIARRVNVDGTRHVGRFVASAVELERFHYVSTFAVAGRRRGVAREDELEHDAGFHNHYEATKHEAEVEVRRLAASGVPTTIYRPAVVVGSSRDGRTTKYDGPYMILKMMRRLPPPLGRLNLGSPGRTFQIVPVDFVVAAMVTIAQRPDAVGKTFHLTDPDPYTTAEIFDLFCRALHGRPCLARVPEPLTRLVTATGVTELLGVQREANPYLFTDLRFDCVNTLDALDGTGVECPRLAEYAPRLVRYFLEHAEPDG